MPAQASAQAFYNQQTTNGNQSSTQFGANYAANTQGSVTYTVVYKKTAPSTSGAAAAFQVTGTVVVNNPAPVNAFIKGLFVSMSSSSGGQPYVVQGSCPSLVVPAGGSLQCGFRATPNFNPTGQSVTATAVLANTRNGASDGHTTNFYSPPALIGAAANATAGRRRLQQTWNQAVPANMPAPVPIFAPAATGPETNDTVQPEATQDSFNSTVLVSGPAPPPKSPPTGLLDDCADVSDVFASGSGVTEGRVTSGAKPSGRICEPKTFTYTVNYGPFNDCADRKASNAATLKTKDTQTTRQSQSDVAIRVQGCAVAAKLMLSASNLKTSASGGYSWTVSKSATPENLVLGPNAVGSVTYTVNYVRSGQGAGAALSGDVIVGNPTSQSVSLQGVSYSMTQAACAKSKGPSSGVVNCASTKIPAGTANSPSMVTCKFTAKLNCQAAGAVNIVAAVGGLQFSSASYKFDFKNASSSAAASASKCATVSSCCCCC